MDLNCYTVPQLTIIKPRGERKRTFYTHIRQPWKAIYVHYYKICTWERRGCIAIYCWHGKTRIKIFNKVIYMSYTDLWPPSVLTHWGRVTHICVEKLTTIGSDNGLSPELRQAIIWTNAGILLIGTFGTNFSEILIEIVCEMATNLSRPHWGLIMNDRPVACVIIGQDTGLSLIRCQAITWTNDAVLSVSDLGAHFSEILSKHINCLKWFPLQRNSNNWRFIPQYRLCDMGCQLKQFI